jgi:DNA replication protein DnaC
MPTLLERAKVHIDRGEITEAVNCLADHLNDDFHDDEAIFLLGSCYLSRGKNGVAASLLRQAIEIRKARGQSFPDAVQNLAACFKAENKMEAAEEIWRIALDMTTDPVERAKILSNIGGCHINNDSAAEALKAYDEAIKIRPDLVTAQFNRSFANLELGNWKQGWLDYEAGFKAGDRKRRTYFETPEWDGSKGKTVIAWGEQGVGDEILFASMLPDLIRDCKHVVYDCHPRLVNLMKRSFPEVEIYGTRKQQNNIEWMDNVYADGAISLSQLGKYYRNFARDFPGTPFLKAPPADCFPDNKRLKVGISWRGGTKKTNYDFRSIPLIEWMPILQNDCDFYSLQYTADAPREVCELEQETGVVVKHWPKWVQCDDYDRTAQFVSGLDLVITVCTSVYHLAGALGKPVWVLTPRQMAWRYTKPNEAWYRQTAKFYRQTEGWTSLLNQVGNDLADYR